MNISVTCIGLVAGALTSLAGVPQVVRTWRTGNARDISIWQPVLLTVGMALWLVYGIALGDLPLILANAFSMACYILLIVMKVRYGDDGRLPQRERNAG